MSRIHRTTPNHHAPYICLQIGIVLIGMVAATGSAVAQAATEAARASDARPEAAEQHDVAPDDAASKVAEPIAVPAAGVRGFLDPVTGEITSSPSPEQIEALLRLTRSRRPALSRSSAGLRVFPLDGGGVGIDLEDRFQSATVIRIGPDGTQTIDCFTDETQIEAWLEGGSTDAETLARPDPHDHSDGPPAADL